MDGQEDEFKKEFKYYKSNKPPPSLDNVINILNENNLNDGIFPISCSLAEDERTECLGLIPVHQWEIYVLKSNPGLIYIKNPFTSIGQRFWIRKCLEDYTRKPNRTNIDHEMEIVDWWQECYRNQECDVNLQNKMRWTTLGYHHNWDTKLYSEDKKTVFPAELSELCDIVSRTLGHRSFSPQAAILNFYHWDSTLSAHTDHSELNLEAPLFSFSFGQSAIFLIGGREKCVKPTAVMLHSGDVLVMTEQARICYHAVPKILPAPYAPWSHDHTKNIAKRCSFKYITNIEHLQNYINKNSDNSSWNNFNSYISKSRININVRQVLKDDQSSL